MNSYAEKHNNRGIYNLGIIVDHRVGENIVARRAREKVGPPPPMIVLTTELEVGHNDGHLRAGDHQDDKDKEEKTK